MPWELTSDRPIYLQLMEEIELRIVSGLYPPGSQLPPVRELAMQAAVNPNTMQKALSELERDGLVFSMRTSGRFITKDEALIRRSREQLACEQIAAFLEKMRQLGYSPEETRGLLQKKGVEVE